MPVIFEKQIDVTKKLAVWHITEQLEELFVLSRKTFNPQLSIKRNTEKVVSHLLVEYLLRNPNLILLNDINGKPYFSDNATSVSFTHSMDMVACIINTSGTPVGIDIEKIRDSIVQIAPKFVTKKDITQYNDKLHFHLIWGAKEVLYKIYSLKNLDFKKHLTVCIQKNDGYGIISNNEYYSEHNLQHTILKDFMLVWGC